jgi:hypothetical protein
VGSSSREAEASLAAFRLVELELERLVFVHFLGVFAFEHWRIPEAGSLLLSLGPFDRGSVLLASIHDTCFIRVWMPCCAVFAYETLHSDSSGGMEVYRMLSNSNVAANEMQVKR